MCESGYNKQASSIQLAGFGTHKADGGAMRVVAAMEQARGDSNFSTTTTSTRAHERVA